MSGRIRTIKPELMEDAVTAGLSDMAFRLFIACILLADDHGRLRYEPGWLAGQVYWARKVEAGAFDLALQELGGLVMAYVVKGQRYAEIRNWNKHQKVSHPGKPRVPLPSESDGDPPEGLPRPSGLILDLGSPILDLGSPTVRRRSEAPTAPDEQTQVRRRGHRLPSDWTPSEATQAWARSEGVADPCGTVLAEFRDFWVGVPGARGVKLDWEGTFRNRIRTIAGRTPASRGGGARGDRQPHSPEWVDRMQKTGSGGESL